VSRLRWVRRVVKPAVFVLAAVPAVLLVRDGLRGGLGANPIEEITRRTGTWGITFLMITLAVTPLRRLLGMAVLIRFRRMLGLWSFFYLSLHFLTYVALDQFFAWSAIVEDVAKRPYISVGFTSFVLLVPLAVTSTKGMVRRLGGRRWQRLHRLVYVAAAGGVLHFLWQVKVEEARPVIYALVFVVLLGYRLLAQRVRGRRGGPTPAPRSLVRASDPTSDF
jgi:sulfoxide reductase heme-binding subunit YedZ